MNPRLLIAVLFLAGALSNRTYAQDSASFYHKVFSFPDRLFGSINRKAEKLQDKLTEQNTRYLQKLARQEKKLRRKLAKRDSAAAARLFNGVDSQYLALQQQVQYASSPVAKINQSYNGHLDSLHTALRFMQQNKLLGESAALQDKLQGSLGELNSLQNKADQTELVNKYLQKRRQQLQEQFGKYGMGKELDQYKQTVYYYRAQMDAYKNMFNDPAAIEAKAVGLLSQTTLFRDFFNKNSALAGLFRLPGSGNDMAGNGAAIAGLQTRDMLQQDLLQRFGNSPNIQQAMQQGVADAQAQLGQVKEKFNQLASQGGGEMDMPNFKPNSQKTKSFWQRLEFGTNLQSTRSNYFFPVSTDFGTSLGYKISDKSVAGLGLSYKMGWGKDIRHINLSHQGIGLRSFADFKLKWNFWLSGGGELNYRSQFRDFTVLNDFSPWQKSALAGLTKKYKAGKKIKGSAGLMYDFLWNQQMPVGQKLVFRVGYTF